MIAAQSESRTCAGVSWGLAGIAGVVERLLCDLFFAGGGGSGDGNGEQGVGRPRRTLRNPKF